MHGTKLRRNYYNLLQLFKNKGILNKHVGDLKNKFVFYEKKTLSLLAESLFRKYEKYS